MGTPTNTVNFSNWENSEYSALIKEAGHLSDIGKRKKILLKATKILIEEMPFIPLYNYNIYYMQKDYVKDVFISKEGRFGFKWAYIDTDL